MSLTHYTSLPMTFDPKRRYRQDKPHGHMKPVGFWVSVDGPDDWKAWCEAEEYGSWADEDGQQHSVLNYAYRVTLAETASLHHIATGEELEAFHDAFCTEDEMARRLATDSFFGTGRGHDDFAYRQRPIDWKAVAKEFDGLLITPYLWSHRLFGPSWYYGWDCASGCIWNLAAVESVNPLISSATRPPPPAGVE